MAAGKERAPRVGGLPGHHDDVDGVAQLRRTRGEPPDPEAFADRGGNYFDTANEVYSGGLSERILGEFVASERHRYVVTTIADRLETSSPRWPWRGCATAA